MACVDWAITSKAGPFVRFHRHPVPEVSLLTTAQIMSKIFMDMGRDSELAQ